MLSKRITKISPSITLAINAKANAMIAKGIDIVNLSAGQPDFDTPDNIKKAAITAIKQGFTKYTPVPGIIELRKAICKKLKDDNNLDYNPEQILVSCGAKHSIYNIMQALLNPNDQVIIPVPYWVSYIEQVKLTGAKPVLLKTKNFKINPDQLKKAINKKTKLIIINSPNNPTGAVYTKQELEKIANIAVENNIYVLSDEIYEKLIYETKHHSIASFNKEIKKLTITINGVSKAYSMTGWRIGYAAGPSNIIKAASNLQSHSTSNPTSISQKAALEALQGPQKSITKMVQTFKKRRDYIVKRLNKIKDITCSKPEATFYVFPNVSELYNGKIKTSNDLALSLLEKAKVAVIPGSAFGDDHFIRISFCCSMADIEKGMDRIEEFVK